jgi:hypothetical protein
MSDIDIIISEIKKVHYIKETYAISSHIFYNSSEIDYNNLGEFGCKISRKLNINNWYLGSYDNYFIIEINEKYFIIYFDNNKIKNTIEVVIRRCNSESELHEMKLAI